MPENIVSFAFLAFPCFHSRGHFEQTMRFFAILRLFVGKNRRTARGAARRLSG